MPNRLYATGFNAWGQLNKQEFQEGADEAEDANTWYTNGRVDMHDDLVALQNMLEHERIFIVRSFLTYTVVETSTGGLLIGLLPEDHKNLHRQFHEQQLNFGQTLDGTVAVRLHNDGRMSKYPSMKAWTSALASEKLEPNLPGCEDINTVVAYHTGFVARSHTSEQIWTFGDARYGACLGREVTAESPADKPGLVTALKDLPTGPVYNIAAGGYMVAALTVGRDLYCWGGRPGLPPVIPDLSGEPEPVIVVGADGKERDIKDVGVGEMHVIVLTTDGEVFVAGSKDVRNGQLGLGKLGGTSPEGTPWTQLQLPGENERAIGVFAGPRASFVLTEFDKDL